MGRVSILSVALVLGPRTMLGSPEPEYEFGYSLVLDPETNAPFGWVAVRPDRGDFAYVLDMLTLQWRCVTHFYATAGQGRADYLTVKGKACRGANLGEILADMAGQDTEWLATLQTILTVRSQYQTLALLKDKIPWPPDA